MATFKAGTAKVNITPDWPCYLAGYGTRTAKHESVLAPIFARALALESADGSRAVQLSLELIGTSDEILAEVQAALASRGVAPAGVRLTCTHTHSAPSIPNVYCGCLGGDAAAGLGQGWANLHPSPESTSRAQGYIDIAAYEVWLVPRIIDAAAQALDALQPATLEHGSTSCGVAVNRRNNEEGIIEQRAEAGTLDKAALLGPVDHDVELLLARAAGGDVLAVLFGYACHATVLGEQSLHGDWPGRAMATLEEAHANVIAMHINGCSGDTNPLPRRKDEYRVQYGDEMAAAVASAALSPTATLVVVPGDATLRCVAMELPLRYHTLPTEAELIRTRDDTQYFAPCMLPTGCSGDGSVISEGARVPANAGADPNSGSWSGSSLVKFDYSELYSVEWAKAMLAKGADNLPQYQPQPYPVSIWTLGTEVTWVALGGEVTLGYV